MIRHIGIRNFAIIEHADIDFNNGLNIITGETGAGKSVVIEAVSLALGSRADTAFVRSGCDKATIQMIADFEGEEYIITREISSTGRSVCRINDEIVTLSALSGLCSGIADIHGQYDHQSLLNPDNHITLVDSYRRDAIDPAKAAVRLHYDRYTELTGRIRELKSMQAENLRQKDFMAFELQELREASLREGEDEDLEKEITLLQNSNRIYENLAGAYHVASESEFSLIAAMKQVSDMVCETAEYSSELSKLGQRVSELYYEFEDICSTIRDSRDKAVFDPEALDKAIERSELLNRLKNKHQMDIPQLIAYADELEVKLNAIENSDETIAALEEELTSVSSAMKEACDSLTGIRKSAAEDLEVLITEQLAQLNFSDSVFSIDFRKSDNWSSEGNDIVEFLITTNKGEPLKPLSRIASGGEMSRIMLAFKKIIGDYDRIPTMIFDEIDSGISGVAASVVGRKLCEIAGNHQIICITHLPQIAAFGTSNYLISKHSDDTMTYTTVEPLSEKEKAHEIARLLGGENITDTTLASAIELISASKQS